MAQGLALGAASRLYNVSEDESILPYIESAFESFRMFNSESRPWSPTVDERNNLWIEEYPDDPPCRVLNGHLYAAFGLYDYWLVSQDEFAADLIRGILTTVEDRLPDFRRPDSASNYCLAHKVQSPNYHAVHIGQLLTAGDITGEPFFTESALVVADDYPLPFMSATTILPAGDYVFYKAMPEDDGTQEEFEIHLETDTEGKVMARQRQILGDSYYYRVQARNWQPYWIKEGSNGLIVSGSLLSDPVNSGDDMGHTRGTLLTLPNPYTIEGSLPAGSGYPSVDGLPDSGDGQVEIPKHTFAEITAQVTHDLKPLTCVRFDTGDDLWIEGTAAEVAGLV
jgi:hypothetical protein